MGKGQKEYKVDTNISMEDLQMREAPVDITPTKLFYNFVFSMFKKYDLKHSGFNGHQHKLIRDVRYKFEEAVKTSATVIVFLDRELRFINDVFYDASSGIESNEIRERIHDKILAAFGKDSVEEEKDDVPEIKIDK
jgi:hypothetical protein